VFYYEFKALLTKFNLIRAEIKLYREQNLETRLRTVKNERLIFDKKKLTFLILKRAN